MKTNSLFALIMLLAINLCAQQVPSRVENIDFIMTYGKNAKGVDGDDDNLQVFYFSIPEDSEESIYVRVFDPSVSGKHDAIGSDQRTKFMFHILSGTGEEGFENRFFRNPEKFALRGNMLERKMFGNETEFDNAWYTFGPLNPITGMAHGDGRRYFRIVAQGQKGNSGNAFKYFVSVEPDRNREVEGCRLYTYEYNFRITKESEGDVHLYPYLPEGVTALKQENFDFDSNASITLFTRKRFGEPCTVSGNGNWVESIHQIHEDEVNSSAEIRLSKIDSWNNDVVFSVKNQYGEYLPFLASPTNIDFIPSPNIVIKP
ncbi:MAG: hypothetical protein HKN32_04170 [Flavobacteriales bacterium]|nr:hypothetical protein [Flavobacteriales bacterium]